MKRYLTYFMFYSFGGWVLERIINLIFLGEWYDNGVLFGPYQGLYGVPVLVTIYLYEFHIKRIDNKYVKELLFVGTAVLFTYVSEYVTGTGYEYLTGRHLWNYSDFLPCKGIYTCYLPSTLFGIVSYLIVKYLHPLVKGWFDEVKNNLIYLILVIYLIDAIITFTCFIK